MSFIKPLARNRCVHVSTVPQARSMTDTRIVLQALRQFGEVEVFHHLKYRSHMNAAPNTFAVIFKEETSATAACAAKELDVHFAKAVSEASSQRSDIGEGSAPERPARITINTSEEGRGYDHELNIQRNPYYATYPRMLRSSLQADMHSRLPKGLHAMANLDLFKVRAKPRQRADWQKRFNERVEAMGPSGYMRIYKEAQKVRRDANEVPAGIVATKAEVEVG